MMPRSWMTFRRTMCSAVIALLLTGFPTTNGEAAEPILPLQLEQGDHIAYIGNTLADRMQHHAWLETYIHALFPEHDLTFRNLGYLADEVKRRDRADTHHSANAVNIGPDGWMYWSRGIFNVANFETPMKTFRSGASGVHRFNPRTFEFEFHFPIGPNPHGDVFDQWGFQFASDGTSGTGSYVHIGKGVGNKKWYTKRVRPVPATGLLSSSHFPPELEGNFLICNAIGVLGVLQHEVKYNGADITAEEIEPILLSSDPNFRPSDVEIGGDGALYVADWHNALIGHMQHNMRDPNRDHEHGRIYRVTYKSRDLVKPARMKGKPIAEVCQNFLTSSLTSSRRAIRNTCCSICTIIINRMLL
jgi:hypothetical protein